MRTKTERLKSLNKSTKSSQLLAHRITFVNKPVSGTSSKLQLLAKTMLMKIAGKETDGVIPKSKEPSATTKAAGAAIVQHKLQISQENKRQAEILKDIREMKKPRPSTQGREDSQRLSHPGHVDLVKALVPSTNQVIKMNWIPFFM